MDLRNNPFAKVFPSIEAAENYAKLVNEAGRTLFVDDIEKLKNEEHNDKDFLINLIVEEVFNLTLCKNPPAFKKNSLNELLYLEDVSGDGKLTYECVASLELVLFERLLLEEPSKHIVFNKSLNYSSPSYIYSHVVETRCFCYLFECYRRLLLKKQEHQDFKHIIEKMIAFVIRNAVTALIQPEVYDKQDLSKQIVDIFYESPQNITELTQFLSVVTDQLGQEEDPDAISTSFAPVLVHVQDELEKCNILSYREHHLQVLHTFAVIPKLAEVMLKQGKIMDPHPVGLFFADTPLGAAFSISVLPSQPYVLSPFFDKPLDSNIRLKEDQIWMATQSLIHNLHEIIKTLLKTARLPTLVWLGRCLDLNAGRSRLAALNVFSPDAFNCVSDGFMLNLSAVLLKLAQPFTDDCNNPKLLKIDPTYPASNVSLESESGVHMGSLSSETCLLPIEEGGSRPSGQRFSFITECFFLCQRALSLGRSVVQEKTQRLYQDIGMMQARLGTDSRSEEMEVAMSKYLSLRCALIEPTTLELEAEFIVATCTWLVQVVLDPDTSDTRETYSPTEFREVKFPLPTSAPPTLRCLPELVLENVCHYLVTTKRFEVGMSTPGQQPVPVLTCLLVFMSGSARARNPHLRAQLAECLDCLLPQDKSNSVLSTFYREQLFKTHPHRFHIVECLLDVFVGIEMTGQSVTFEQKFNYRRPMYTVMEYLWNLDEQKDCFKRLAVEAEANMEAVNPPLFLRFLNLLINDAVFLLDEALSNMASLRTMLTARENGEWQNLPQTERQRNETTFMHTGMTARFDNILGTKTIECLVYLSTEIKSIFCHPTMVDRIAAMLNYFLLHLVGPKKKNFKVKDQQKEYMFNPAAIVQNICKIYIHLSESNEFCAAVSRDGRSYSPQLFTFAEDVLVRIGGASYLTELQEVASKVNQLAGEQQREDELLADVPDDFLDPIMSTLMTDPVLLPSSRQIVDRSTIARHLLSDQSDPFNREPLTMDMVKSATELKQKIDTWVSERHQNSSL